MKTPKAPKTPDPNVVSAAQTQSNQDTAAYNAAIAAGNVTTPFGNSTFSQRTDPVTGAPIWDQTITATPDQQRIIDAQGQQDLELANLSNSLIGQAQGQMGQSLDLSRLPGLETLGATGGPGIQGTLDTNGLPQLRSAAGITMDNLPQLYGADDLEGSRKALSDALYSRQASFLDPQYDQREDRLRTRLATQGITQNSEAWNNAFDEFNRGREFSYGQARDSAISGSGDELSRMMSSALANRNQAFGERSTVAANDIARSALDASNRGQMFGEREAAGVFQNSAEQQALASALARISGNNATRAQGVQEDIALRQLPLNELNAIRGATSVDMPQFEGASNAGANSTDVAGNVWNAYSGNLNNYNANMQSRNNLLGGLMGLGGSLGVALLSDRRTKEAIQRIGTGPHGLPIYQFRYKGGTESHVGVMSDEVREVMPEAVVVGDDGYDRVDYGMVFA